MPGPHFLYKPPFIAMPIIVDVNDLPAERVSCNVFLLASLKYSLYK